MSLIHRAALVAAGVAAALAAAVAPAAAAGDDTPANWHNSSVTLNNTDA